MNSTFFISFLAWFVFGALAGWLASKIARYPLSFTWSVIVGVCGSLIGGIVLYILDLPFKIYGFSWLSPSNRGHWRNPAPGRRQHFHQAQRKEVKTKAGKALPRQHNGLTHKSGEVCFAYLETRYNPIKFD